MNTSSQMTITKLAPVYRYMTTSEYKSYRNYLFEVEVNDSLFSEYIQDARRAIEDGEYDELENLIEIEAQNITTYAEKNEIVDVDLEFSDTDDKEMFKNYIRTRIKNALFR